MNSYPAKPISFLDRILGAFIAFFSVFLTLSFFAIIFIGLLLPRRRGLPMEFISTIIISPLLWVFVLALLAAIWGAHLGSLGVIKNLGHLWGTEIPPNKKLAEKMWWVIGTSALVTFILAIVFVGKFK